jgi:hypothetical protein
VITVTSLGAVRVLKPNGVPRSSIVLIGLIAGAATAVIDLVAPYR